MNIKLLSFESFKIFKSNKNRITFILAIITVLLLLFLNNLTDSKISMGNQQNLLLEIESINNAIVSLPDTEATKSIREDYSKRKELLEKQNALSSTNQWKEKLNLQIELDEDFLAGLENNSIVGGEPRDVVESRVVLNKELIKRNIPPINENYSTEGFYFLKNVMSIFLGIGGVILVVFLTGDILAKELEKGTIKLLFTQPFSRISLLNAKFLIAIATSVFLFLLVGFTAFIVATLLYGVGAADYPILVQNGVSFSFINLIDYLLLSFVLFFFVIIMMVAFSLLISVVTSSSSMSIALTVIISGLFYLLVINMGYFSSLAHLIPFTYINSIEVSNGTLASNLENGNINFKNGIFITLIFTLLTYIFTSYLLGKKDIK